MVWSSKPIPANTPLLLAREEKECVFVVTGFGSFAGVEKNPTEELIQGLQQEGGVYRRGIVVADVWGVDRQSVLDGIQQAKLKLAALNISTKTHHVVWVHCGVDMGLKEYALEEFAVNNADFSTYEGVVYE